MKNKACAIKRICANVFWPLLSLGLVLAVWAIVSAVKNNPLALPMPGDVIARFFTLGKEPDFWLNVGSTLFRTVTCFAVSFLAALLLAALAGLWRPLNKILSPIVTFLRAAPTVAVILILYVFFENDLLSVAVGFLIAFPILYTAFYSAVAGVDTELLEMAKVYKVKKTDTVLHVYLPSIAECLFDNGRSTLSLTLKIVVAAEILTYVPHSIGDSIQTANASFEMEYLLAWTLVAIVFSFVLELCVFGLKKLWEALR